MQTNKNYKKYASEIGKVVFIFIVILVVQRIFFPSPQQDEWRSLPPELLKANSQADITSFIDTYKINEDSLQKELSPLGVSLDEFKKSVEINFLLDQPKDQKYGVTLVFRATISHELLSPVYTNIVNDFLGKFRSEFKAVD